MARKNKEEIKIKNFEKKKAKIIERQYRKMERSAKFWNKIDPANKFRHWYFGIGSFGRSLFRTVAAWQTIVILTTTLGVLYVMAAFYTGKGEFVVKLDRPMSDAGFLLSETMDFSDRLVSLRDDAVEDVTNISMDDIPKNVMDVDGKHNGKNYVAYTFYLKNETGDTQDYRYELTLRSRAKNVETATWIMLFYNGKQKTYAQKNQKGYTERLYRRWDIPFVNYAVDPKGIVSVIEDDKKAYLTKELAEYYGYQSAVGLKEMNTYPWMNQDVVCSEKREKIKDHEVDKYTVVIWLEGDDPDCTDDLFGGHVEFNMNFTYY